MTAPDGPAAFRRNATRAYQVFVVVLLAAAIGLLVVGWSIGGFWGLVGFAAIAFVVVGGGLFAGTMIWAMTQDGA